MHVRSTPHVSMQGACAHPMFSDVEYGQWTDRKEIGVAITANLANPVIATKSDNIPSK